MAHLVHRPRPLVRILSPLALGLLVAFGPAVVAPGARASSAADAAPARSRRRSRR